MMPEPEYLELPEWTRGEVRIDKQQPPHQSSKGEAETLEAGSVADSLQPEDTFELDSDRFLLEIAKVRAKILGERANRKWYIRVLDFFRW